MCRHALQIVFGFKKCGEAQSALRASARAFQPFEAKERCKCGKITFHRWDVSEISRPNQSRKHLGGGGDYIFFFACASAFVHVCVCLELCSVSYLRQRTILFVSFIFAAFTQSLLQEKVPWIENKVLIVFMDCICCSLTLTVPTVFIHFSFFA